MTEHIKPGVIKRGGRCSAVLLSPVTYRMAHGSLGFHAAYRGLNTNDCYCERAVFDGTRPRSLESNRVLSAFDVIFVSLAWEMEVFGLIDALNLESIPADRTARDSSYPLVIAGGPLTFSNPDCLYPIADAIFVGEADHAFSMITESLSNATSRENALERLAAITGMWVPLRTDQCPPLTVIPRGFLPQHTQVITDDTTFGNAFLVEVGRGCVRRCGYCVVSGARVRPRFVEPQKVLDVIPQGTEHVGLIAPAVSYHPGLSEILKPLVDAGTLVTVSSVAADGIDEKSLALLAKGGLNSITTAADGASERLRAAVNRKVRNDDLLNFAKTCASVGIRRVKLYLVVGLPGETPDDFKEFADIAAGMAGLVSLTVSAGPLIPKKNTALANAKFIGKAAIRKKYKELRKILPKGVNLSIASIKHAQQEARLAALNLPTLEEILG